MQDSTILYNSAVLIEQLYSEGHLKYEVFEKKINEIRKYAKEKISENEKEVLRYKKLALSLDSMIIYTRINQHG